MAALGPEMVRTRAIARYQRDGRCLRWPARKAGAEGP